MLSTEEVDEKSQQIEELRTAYRQKYNELKVLLGSNYEESYTEDCKKRLMSVKNYIYIQVLSWFGHNTIMIAL